MDNQQETKEYKDYTLVGSSETTRLTPLKGDDIVQPLSKEKGIGQLPYYYNLQEMF